MVIIILLVLVAVLCLIIKLSTNDNSQSDYTTHTNSYRYEAPPERDVPPRGTPYKKTTVVNTKGDGVVTVEKSVTETCFNGYVPKPHPQLKPAYHYKVNGKNSLTNRRKTLTIYAYDEKDAQRRAEIQTLVAPFNIDRADDAPTERQLAAAAEAEIILPVGATKEDVSNIFGLLFDGEATIKQSTVDYVLKNDIVISPYATEPRAKYIIKKLGGATK